MGHCNNLVADRQTGAQWERNFCALAGQHGFTFTPMQLAHDGAAAAYSCDTKWHTLLLPDVVIWTAPGQSHEIKHKEPTRNGRFGLEAYRFDALLQFANVSQMAVFYTIHDHSVGNANAIEEWKAAKIVELDGQWCYTQTDGVSWVNGVKRDGVKIYYWPTSIWQALATVWAQVDDCVAKYGVDGTS